MKSYLLLCLSLLCCTNLQAEIKTDTAFYSEDVSFKNKAQKVKLAGTLTLPYKGFRGKTVVLISGSGPQDRNEEIFGYKPFLQLAEYLTRAGIGVLRYDDRGVGVSTGEFQNATTYDFSLDAEAAVGYLCKRKFKNVGLLGHSEGGIVAPMVAVRNEDISFVVMLAGPGLRGDSLMLLQQQAVGYKNKWPEETLRFMWESNARAFSLLFSDSENLSDTLTYTIRELMGSDFPEEAFEDERKEQQVQAQVEGLLNPWMRYFLTFAPQTVLQKLHCPVLALNGAEDIQVVPEPNIRAIASALQKAGNRRYETEIIPGLNHLFQHCTSCTIEEYKELSVFSEYVLQRIADWIKGLE